MMGDHRGFALVLTLIITALLVAVTSELIHQVYVDTALSRTYRDGQQASLLAESGISGGTKYLRTVFSDKYTYPLDPLSQDDESGSLQISFSEESGKINLNDLAGANGTVDTDLRNVLSRLGKQLGIPDQVWDALVDWLDSDDLPYSSGGVESAYYRTMQPPYDARNGKLASVAELSMIRGVTPAMVDGLRPFVTVFPSRPGGVRTLVNVNTAPKEVLMALDGAIDAGLAERIIEERKQRPFKDLGGTEPGWRGWRAVQQSCEDCDDEGNDFQNNVAGPS